MKARLLFAFLLLALFVPWPTAAQNLTVKAVAYGAPTQTATVTGQASLSDAISALSSAGISSIAELEISAGTFTAADWDIVKYFNVLKSFTITDGVTAVADMPAIAPWSGAQDNNMVFYQHYGGGQVIGSIKIAKMKAVGENALRGFTSLTTLELPDVEEIRDGAFYNCTNEALTELVMPKVKTIGSNTFTNVRVIDLNIPECISIGDNAFSGCKNLTTVYAPQCTDIGTGVFSKGANGQGGKKLVEITAGFSAIEAEAFRETRLTHISLPNCTSIGENAFRMCQQLISIDLPEVVHIGNGAFYNCNNENLVLLNMPKVQIIGKQAFQSVKMVELELPELLTVGESAFNGCKKLEGFEAVRLQSIGSKAFSGAAQLTRVNIGECTAVEGEAFRNCSKLASFTASKLQVINDDAFRGTVLTEVDLPECVVVGKNAFRFLPTLLTVNLPKVQSIDSGAFHACQGLISANLPEVKTLGASAFSSCVKMVSFEAPKVQVLGDNALFACRSLTHLYLPEVTTVGNQAMAYLRMLRSIDLSGVTSIGNFGLRTCPMLTLMQLSPTAAPTVGDSAFYAGATPRYLQFASANLQDAMDLYKAVDDGNTTDDLWYGWNLSANEMYNLQGTTPNPALGTVYAVTPKVPKGGNAAAMLIPAPGMAYKVGSIAAYSTADPSMSVPIADAGNNLFTLTMPNHDVTVSAEFEANTLHILVNGTTPLSGTSLEKALAGQTLADIELLMITAGSFAQGDWQYLYSSLSNLRRLTVGGGVQAVADIPAQAEYTPYLTSLSEAQLGKVYGIGEFAFYQSSLIVASLPNVQRIYDKAFYGSQLTNLLLGATPPALVGTGAFGNCPSPRYLLLADANGTPLTGDALTAAVATYKADAGWDGSTWHGFTLPDASTNVESVTTGVCPGSTYDWNGTAYGPGLYIDAGDPSSIKVLNLVEYPSFIAYDTVAVCGSYTFGTQSLDASGDYAEVFTSIMYGCDSTVHLNLTINTCFDVTVTASPAEGGSVNGMGAYNENATATLTATANTGYRFVRWKADGTELSTSNPYSFTVTADMDVVAEFELLTYQLSYTATEGGSINGSATQSVKHGQDGTEVEAVPSTGYRFVKWSDGLTMAKRIDQNITDNMSFEAQFELLTYLITYTATEGGVIAGNTTQAVKHGQNGTEVEAVAYPGYRFVKWSDGLTTANRTAQNVTAHFGATAEFEVDEATTTYTVAVTASPAEGGGVSGAGTYNQNATATLTATANAGYRFVRWTDGSDELSTANPYSIAVTANMNLVAEFEADASIITHTVTATASPAEGGSVNGMGTYNENATATLTATANTGYRFVRWKADGTELSTSNPYSFTVTADMDVVAEFEVSATTYTVAATAIPAEGGSVNGAGIYNEGATATLTALASSGYQFVGWEMDGISLGSINPYSLSVLMDMDVEAVFERVYTISAMAIPADGGSVNGAGTFIEGATATLTATANAGYRFVHWEATGAELSTDNPYSFGVTADMDVKAVFEAIPPCTPYNHEFSATASDSYEWNGQVYTQSGHYVAHLKSVDGCDSTVTLHLTIVSTTGLFDSRTESLSLHPNPTTGELWVTVPSTGSGTVEGTAAVEVQVYTARGQLVVRQPVQGASAGSAPTTGRVRIDLSGQPAGIYIVRLGNAVAKVMRM